MDAQVENRTPAASPSGCSSQRDVDAIYVPYALSLARNTTRYQHSTALACGFRLQVLLGKGPYPEALAAIAKIRICPGGGLGFMGRLFYLVWVLLRVASMRYRSGPRDAKNFRLLLVTTHQPLCIVAGAMAQRIFGVTWVADIFDVPALGLETTWQNRESLGTKVGSIPHKLITKVAYRLLKHADLVLCTLVPDALATCRIPSRKVLALTNGVEIRTQSGISATDSRPDVFDVLYVGFVLRIRGLDTMLDACSLLYGRVPGLRLWLVGPSTPKEREWLDRRIADLGLKTVVSVTGELPHDEVLSRVHEADLCLFPFPKNYATEFIYPVKVLEYIAAGRTVIASDLAGIRRIIEDGHSGILVEPSNPRALADAMYLLWKRPELRLSLAANARAAAPKFEWDRINGQILKALHILAEERQ